MVNLSSKALFYDTIRNMNKKQTALLAGLLGAGVLAASAKFYMDIQEERQKAAALKQVRDFFTDFGPIVTVFVNEVQSSKACLVGGVVMENGLVYLFENQAGQISYEEEEGC